MASNNIVFQQISHPDGSSEFRVNFGRKKSLVYRRHEGYYYLDIYNNKEGRKRFNGNCFGLDELDFLISIIGNLESLQDCFPAMHESATENQGKWGSVKRPQQEAKNVQSTFKAVPYPTSNHQDAVPYLTSNHQDAIPYPTSNHQDRSMNFKGPAPIGESRPVKYQRIENISPEPKDDNFNHQELFNDFFECN